MGKADTHRDAHLRLFIPRSTYNTPITGDIPLREGDDALVGREGKHAGSRGKDLAGEQESREMRRNVHSPKSLKLVVVVVPPLNALSSSRCFLLTLFFPILFLSLFRNVLPRLAPLPMHFHR